MLDDDPAKIGRSMLDVEIVGPFDSLSRADAEQDEVQNLVARTTVGRQRARLKIAQHGIPFATLISPNVDTEGVTYATDVVVYHNATLGPEAFIGESTVVFMGAVVGHECRIGHGCVVASNAVLNARVELEDLVYVGTNATVLPETRAGFEATIGAGSVVVQDVPAGATAFGVPAQVVVRPSSDDSHMQVPFSEALGSEIDVHSSRIAPHLLVREFEQVLSDIWTSEIGLVSVGPDDNFFDVGGHSLLALRILERVKEQTLAELSISDIFRFPTVRSLAEHLGAKDTPAAVRQGGLRRAIRRRRARGV